MKAYFKALWVDPTFFIRTLRGALTFFGVWASTSPKMLALFGGGEIPAAITALGVFLKSGDKNNVDNDVARVLNRSTPVEVQASMDVGRSLT